MASATHFYLLGLLVLGLFVAVAECASPVPEDHSNIVTEIPIRWEWMFDDGNIQSVEGESRFRLLSCPAGKVVKIIEAIYIPNQKTQECLDWATKLVDTVRAGRVCNGNKQCNAVAAFQKSTARCDGWVYKTTHTCVPEGSIIPIKPEILRS